MKPAERSEVKSLITDAAREAVMEEAVKDSGMASSITRSESLGPTLLLDAIDPDELRFVKRYCAWLARGLVSDAYIAARFDRSFQRLRRLGGKGALVINSSDMPKCWDGPAPDVEVFHSVLKGWIRNKKLTKEEKHVIHICINECNVRIARRNDM